MTSDQKGMSYAELRAAIMELWDVPGLTPADKEKHFRYYVLTVPLISSTFDLAMEGSATPQDVVAAMVEEGCK